MTINDVVEIQRLPRRAAAVSTTPLIKRGLVLAALLVVGLSVVGTRPAAAQVAPEIQAEPAVATQPATAAPAAAQAGPTGPAGPQGPTGPDGNSDASVRLDINGVSGKPSQSITIIILLTVLGVAPALLIMLTSFSRIIIVLGLTRNALGVQTIPPNQVLVGLALFLSLFIMSPTLKEMNEIAVQPFLNGKITQQQAFDKGVVPLRKFMLKHTRKSELGLFIKVSGAERPKTPDKAPLAALVPAFILSELKTAFIIGFVVFIPFLVIDLIVSSSLMSMGMMMLPPVLVSLPFKLLLFVLVDGWALIVRSLVNSFA